MVSILKSGIKKYLEEREISEEVFSDCGSSLEAIKIGFDIAQTGCEMRPGLIAKLIQANDKPDLITIMDLSFEALNEQSKKAFEDGELLKAKDEEIKKCENKVKKLEGAIERVNSEKNSLNEKNKELSKEIERLSRTIQKNTSIKFAD